MKKKLTALALVAGLIALMVAGSTLAYFKDTDDAVNVFTMGNVDILLHEDNGLATTDENYKLDADYENWVAEQDFLPTVILEKDAWIENDGSEEAYVRMFILYPEDIAPMLDIKYDEALDDNWADATWGDNDEYSMADVVYTIGEVDYIGKCLVYKNVLEAGATTTDTITSVTLKGAVECKTLADGTIEYSYYDKDADTTYTYTDKQGDFPVFVIAQAGQVTNKLDESDPEYWNNANDALNIMFGTPAAENMSNHISEYMQDVASGDIVVKGTILAEIPEVEEYTVDGAEITKIGEYAANGNETLKSVTITEGVTTIGNRAFRNTTNLETVVLPDTITTIESGAFQGSGISSINLPDSITTIGEAAFRDTINLTEVTIPAGVSKIEKMAFRGFGATEITIPATVTEIGEFAFRECPNLESVYIEGENVTFTGTSMTFSNKQTGVTTKLTVYVKNEAMAAAVKASSGSSVTVEVVVQ